MDVFNQGFMGMCLGEAIREDADGFTDDACVNAADDGSVP